MNLDLVFCWGIERMRIDLSPQCFQKGWGSRFPPGAPVPGLPLCLSFRCGVTVMTWLLPPRPLNLKVFHSLSLKNLGWQQWQSNFHHCCNSMISYIFFLNWGPSRTSICHGVTISSYLPDGEQFRSWTTKVLPIKLGHINKLSYILLITLLSVSRK